MPEAFAAAGLLWGLTFVYALAGAVDFGATFWRLVYALRRMPAAERVAARYVSPLWETTNVFLVLIAVVLLGFFPGAASALGTVLLLPGSLILLLLALRGAFLGYAYAGGRAEELSTYVAGGTAVLLPALLVTVLPITQGGMVRAVGDRLELDLGALLGSPITYAYLAFGLGAGLFLSSVFLADYAYTAGDGQAWRVYRTDALWSGPGMMLAGVTALFLIPSAPWLQARLQATWPWFLGSAVLFLLALGVLAWPEAPRGLGRPRWAVVLAGLQFSLADIGYGLAHAPYILYPQVPTTAAFSNEAMFRALLWVVLVGMGLLVPAFLWLWRLFVLDPRYTRR
jgi:cytochrome d ubiquinol oxidase subunit II